MKRILSFACLLVLSYTAFSQNWLTNFDEAKQTAVEKKQVIVLVFQGSDWCAPCMKLDKEIWSTETFQQYATKHYVMLQADFPKRKSNRLPEAQQKHNDQLAEKYNSKGYFPHVVIFDSEGKVLGRLGYEKVSPAEYIKKIDQFIKS
jgi:thioredoxin-related protein